VKDFSVQDCPKCRTHRIAVRMFYCDKVMGTDRPLCPVQRHEHMHHQCGHCGYAWITRTADCPVPPPAGVSPRTKS